MSEPTQESTVRTTVDRAHLASMRERLDRYRQRHAAVLKKEQEKERIDQAEAETRKRLQELLEAEQAQQQNPTNSPSNHNNIPPQLLSNAFAMVSEKDAISWLKANNPEKPSSASSPSPSLSP
ncbi:hypothetical protein BDB00DRAFT_869622 [Zychaea mexicana]|uniref:uncharacterized protein n=1 Tax=Zychaea mexicana TaxID=64656 RepID=UPI0022FDCE86|nr:uncharacterized protein BDB00DRAFT_869622 [Zychaea mexicana]KAI9496325.1 hypothetical protein BDB00DRAFT_869622 [Zychaea mexicana]